MSAELEVQMPFSGMQQYEKPATPTALLQLAVERNASIETIERLAALQEHMMDRTAEGSFNAAMQRCQERMKRIGADAVNPQTHSRYATYSKLDAVLRPIYTAEHFSLSFNTEPIEKADVQRVVCYVSHKDPDVLVGHTRTYRIDMPSDGKGAKGNDVMSKTHATGSAASYGMRYLLKMIFNVAVGETDDDGNQGEVVSQDQGADWVSRIEEGSSMEEVMKSWTEAVAVAKKINDYKAMTIFTEARDKKLLQIKRGAR